MAGHAIFISYRRDDTMDVCGRVYDRLAAAFGADAIFRDVDKMPFGTDFREHIVKTLEQCRVVLVLIGPSWLNARERLDDPDDPVRLEIEEASKAASVQVIPVLVNGARMPATNDLPSSLQFLTRISAPDVRRDPDFHKDMDRLIAALKEGALTGFVEIEAPTSGPQAATAIWKQLQSSIDVAELRRFAESFPGTTEAFEARRSADALAAIGWKDLSSIDKFLTTWPSHPALETVRAKRAAIKADQERHHAEHMRRLAAEARQKQEAQEREREQARLEQQRAELRREADEQRAEIRREADEEVKRLHATKPIGCVPVALWLVLYFAFVLATEQMPALAALGELRGVLYLAGLIGGTILVVGFWGSAQERALKQKEADIHRSASARLVSVANSSDQAHDRSSDR